MSTEINDLSSIPLTTTPPQEQATDSTNDADPPSSSKRPRQPSSPPSEPLSTLLQRRVTTIKEGDNVLLRLPSDTVKAVVASHEGLLQLGKFGAIPASQLLGLHYDITYEIVAGGPGEIEQNGISQKEDLVNDEGVGKKKKKKDKRKGKDMDVGTHPGWNNILRPLKEKRLVEAVLDDVRETNQFIDDTEEARQALLSQEEILDLRSQGISAEEMIQRQISRHERFELKTDFSKEKWRRRKEKKYLQTVIPIAPTIQNMLQHYATRAPQSILYLRDDTMSQMLVLANIRPGGKYLVVDDTGGLVTAAVIDRMGGEGRIMLFNENDSPPAWGILGIMNFGQRELECVKWLNWMEMDEEYERPPPPEENGAPVSLQKSQTKMRRHLNQVAELNATRDELYMGNWDGLILATELSPISIISRLIPYLGGSAPIVVYSPYLQILAEVLHWSKKDPRFLNATLTESWSRTYQVLPGRTHPLMTTSATGGYIYHALRIHPSAFEPMSKRIDKKRKKRPEGTTMDTEVVSSEIISSRVEEEVGESAENISQSLKD
ncbi:hypothetical protein M231_00719 [Tremella mesenterica]|uniref:tRNA (adenine(58)-N(1))-methyltransferase non-catalytic subunit TRM6 n=1 Tax=Tremella mesenterica TaxID=5217 RepID=A0A4Q1BVB2_TREME|nr:hypothetical protein M231_00719 [Tremella mesenterica]